MTTSLLSEHAGADFDRRRVLRVLTGALLWAVTGYLAVLNLRYYVPSGVGMDAHAYWLAGRSSHPYGLPPRAPDAFLYSPLFAQAMRPLALLPWAVFLPAWMVAESAAFWWLAKPLPWIWRVPVLLLCVPEVLLGNVYGFLGVAAVLALRRPGFVAFALLTKVTVALPNLAWLAFRRDWHGLLRASLWTGGLVGVSVALSPRMWVDWLHFLAAGSSTYGPTDRIVRMLLTVALVWWGVRRGRAGVVPLGMLLSLPHLGLFAKDITAAAGFARADADQSVADQTATATRSSSSAASRSPVKPAR